MPTHRAPQLKPGHCAERVFQEIPFEPLEPISGDELAARTGLTRSQVQNGVAWLRDACPDWPLLSTGKGYRFSQETGEVASFRQWRARNARTTIRRLFFGAIKPHLTVLPAPEAKYVSRQFERLIEDLEMTIG